MSGEAMTPDANADFKAAMSSFPSGVTIVTTVDEDGKPWGFTATSFCSVSMSPPLVLVCLADTAECHSVFSTATKWNVQVIHAAHTELAIRFATRGVDKFTGTDFLLDERGVPYLESAAFHLTCVEHAKVPGGDHTILIGKVEDTRLNPEEPSIYFRRKFHGIAPPA